MAVQARGRRPRGRWVVAVASVAALALASGGAHACDGKSYEFNIATGANVTGGGLTVRLDQVKLIDDAPDNYYISVKDDGTVLATHMMLKQFTTLEFPTRCGTVSIGAHRKSMFASGQLAVNWSYF